MRNAGPVGGYRELRPRGDDQGDGLYAYFPSLLLQGIVSLYQEVEPCQFVLHAKMRFDMQAGTFRAVYQIPGMIHEIFGFIIVRQPFGIFCTGTGVCRHQVLCAVNPEELGDAALCPLFRGIFFCISFIIKEEIVFMLRVNRAVIRRIAIGPYQFAGG